MNQPLSHAGSLAIAALKVFQESEHPRDDVGQFTAGAGHEASGVEHNGSKVLHIRAEKLSEKWLDRAKELPATVVKKAKDLASHHYTKLEERYGTGIAVGILAAGIVGTAIPLPGATILTTAPLIGLAEIYKKVRSNKEAKSMKEPSDEELQELAKKLIKELLEEWKGIEPKEDEQEYLESLEPPEPGTFVYEPSI